MSARAGAVLLRFPRHIGATDPGKRFGTAVGALAAELDVLTRQVGDVRSGHRLGEAPTRRDLLGLAALHGFSASVLEPLDVRLQALSEAVGADPVDSDAVAALVNVGVDTLALLGDALAAVADEPARHRPSLRLARAVVAGAVQAHAVGNATPTALLVAAVSYLGLDVEQVVHTEERWWHLARCRDRVRLVAPVPEQSGEGQTPAEPVDLSPLPDLLALEENPFRDAELDPAPKRHAQRFRVLRGGLEDVDVTVRVQGIGVRTVRPMVVHVDAGKGVVYEGDVPDGQELAFESTGRVTLAGGDVTGSAWSFSGGVFASSDEALAQHDFRFADEDALEPDPRRATFVVTAPVTTALDPTAAFPHGGAAVGPLRLPLGESRWVCFARVAHAGAGVTTPAIPRTAAGRLDASVFADATTALDPSLAVGFAWQEREPFTVRVLLPRRLSTLDDEAGTVLRQPLRFLLDRHRAAGVDVRLEYADPRWTLGNGVVRDTEDQAIGTVLAGTELWPDGTSQPTP